jgi:TolB-like protein/tetratricopeptide (TPR) repeat protein
MLIIIGAVWLVSRTTTAVTTAPRSIAVLPCTSTIQDSQKRYLGEIITQDLIAELGKRRLFEKVIAPASIERYRGSTKSAQEIRAELRVEALLYCEYEQAGSQERVRVKLVDGRSASPQWTREFRRDLTVTSTATLPVAVVDAMSQSGQIGKPVPMEMASARTPDLSALNLYKEGQYYLTRFTEHDVRHSIYLFNESLARDSAFALPYVGLSRAYLLLGIAFGSMEPLDAFPLMKQSADRALSLDDHLAAAHVLLGEYEMAFGWHWAIAETHLRRAIELDPYDPYALQSLAYYLTLVGRYDEVPALSSRAIDLSPVDPMVWNNAGRNYLLAGRFDDALLFTQKGLELAPDFPPLLVEAGHLESERGDARRGVEYLRRADSLSGHQVIIRGRLAYAYALAGDFAASRAILRQLKSEAVGSRPPAKTATAIAVVYIGLGERDSAFRWLNIAYEQRSGNLVHVLRSPSGWRRLVSDPRYPVLLARVGLTPTALAPVVVAARH